ncbi:hypothetical protein ADEAN_000135600 [Angomonas deanei]|uniref:Uncharacterized protein n=1 Tax=Angomonas deanei TaxID=59799 RepID=A0A7G2C7F7_9TRYP|nr:hypothetical protein ADEAN_000135600 [Angomonas deanei]
MMNAQESNGGRNRNAFLSDRPNNDAEEILSRAMGLVVKGIQQSKDFIYQKKDTNSPTSCYYDALGTLKSAINLLQEQKALLGGPAQTSYRNSNGEDVTTIIPQKVTKLLLLSHLCMALLFMIQRRMNESLPFIQSVVATINLIPTHGLLHQTPSEDSKGTEEDEYINAGPARSSTEDGAQ